MPSIITALVELLDEKGVIEYVEWEIRIREKIEKVKGLTKGLPKNNISKLISIW